MMSGKSGMSGTPPVRARCTNAFPCPTWLSLCRAHVGHVGRARLHGASCGTDGRHGPDAARGWHGEAHAAPDGYFPLVAGFFGLSALPAASMRGKCGGTGLSHAGKVKKHEPGFFVGVFLRQKLESASLIKVGCTQVSVQREKAATCQTVTGERVNHHCYQYVPQTFTLHFGTHADTSYFYGWICRIVARTRHFLFHPTGNFYRVIEQ